MLLTTIQHFHMLSQAHFSLPPFSLSSLAFHSQLDVYYVRINFQQEHVLKQKAAQAQMANVGDEILLQSLTNRLLAIMLGLQFINDMESFLAWLDLPVWLTDLACSGWARGGAWRGWRCGWRKVFEAFGESFVWMELKERNFGENVKHFSRAKKKHGIWFETLFCVFGCLWAVLRWFLCHIFQEFIEKSFSFWELCSNSAKLF